MCSRGCGRLNGTNCESAVVSVAVHSADAEPIEAVGVQVTALPRLLDPFLNRTVPVGPAPLLVVEIFAVSVKLPPDTTLATLLLTAVVVAAFVIVTFSAADVLAL